MKSSAVVVTVAALVGQLGVSYAGQVAAAPIGPAVARPQSDRTPNYASVSALSPTDAWIGGIRSYPVHGQWINKPTTQHWDGSRWTPIDAPKVDGQPAGFDAMYDVGPDDAWAAGISGSEAQFTHLLLDHWDGTAWSPFSLPEGLGTCGKFDDFAGDADGSIWLVGGLCYGGDFRPLALRWDGTAWIDMSAPQPAQHDSALNGVTVISDEDVWAVGSQFMEHWDGSAWTIYQPADSNGLFARVSGSSPTDVWAVGAIGCASSFCTHAEHWDGDSWSVVPTPNGTHTTSDLTDVSDLGPEDVLAIGNSASFMPQPTQTLLMRWDGSRWILLPTPNPAPGRNSFDAISRDSSNDGWIVGQASTHVGGSQTGTILCHWLGRGCIYPWTQDP